MSTIIQLKYGTSKPSANSLKVAELGVDIFNKTIYTSTDGTDIVELAGGDIDWNQINPDTYPDYILNLIPGVGDNYVDLVTLELRVKANEESIGVLQDTVGDATKGLVKDVIDLRTDLDALADSITGDGGISSEIEALQQLTFEQGQQITINTNAIGDENSGLTQKVNQNTSDISDLKDAIDKDLTGLVFGGSYDADKNEITSTSQSGQDAGLRVQGKLNEYLTSAYEGLYVIVDEEGVLEDTVRDGYDGKTAHVGDWMVSDGVHGWILMEFGNEHVTWGTIGGDIGNQSDLQAALGDKLSKGETIECGNY